MEITIRELEKPLDPDLQDDMDWICRSLGFVSPRDSEATASKIFCSIVKAMASNADMNSEELADRANVTRGAAVHHLKAYIDSGIVMQKRTRYVLRARSIERTIEEMELDLHRILTEIKSIAREVDSRLGMKER